MEKSFLEKRIEQIALEQTDNEYQEFVNFMLKNKFAKSLRIKVYDKDIPLAYFGCNYALLNNDCLKNNDALQYTNLEYVYNKVLDENVKKETDNILRQLESINYLFEQVKE